jgi:hypothetical protein
VALPERLTGFVVEAGRAVGRDLPAVDARDSLLPWRDAIGGKAPFFARVHGSDLDVLAQVRRLSTLGELWLETPLGSIDHAIDLLVAGAHRLVVPVGQADAELLEAVGPSVLVGWDGATPWAEAQAAALAHDAPVLASRAPPADAACDVFLIRERADGPRLERVASAPAAAPAVPPAGEGEAE